MAYSKEYYLKHKEKIAEYNKNWRENNKEKWNEINRKNSIIHTYQRENKIRKLKEKGVINARRVVLNGEIPKIKNSLNEFYKNKYNREELYKIIQGI